MKTIPKYCYRINPLLFVIASLGPGPRLLADAPAGSPPETKTHTLFMGADFDVQRDKEFFRAHHVASGSFVIKVNGRELLVPMDRGPVNLRVSAELKLTDASATVVDLKTERAYTPGKDPVKKFNAAAAAVTADQYTMGWAQANLNNAYAAMENGRLPWQNPGVAGSLKKDSDAYMNAVSQAESTFNNAALQSTSPGYSMGYHAGVMEDEKEKELYDAVEVTFVVSSPKPLTRPYVVFVAQYREPDEKPGTVHNWIYAQELDAIDEHPRRERIKQGGFPPGFILGKFQLHLYNHGNELATTVADKQVPLTRDEAFEYLLLDYLGSHKTATIAAATPALGRLAPEVRSRLPAGAYRQTFYVKVNKEGRAETAYVDEDCAQRIDDPSVEALIKEVRFKPALLKGRPVEGIAKLKFNELTM